MPELRRRRRSRSWRRLRRLRRERPFIIGVAAIGVLVVGSVLWSVWLTWSTSRDLGQVRESASVMRAALIRGDVDSARAALDDYQEAAASAESRTTGLTWSVLGAMPILGDDVEGIAVAARVLDGVGRDGLPPVTDAAELVTAETFQPDAGRFPVERIAAMEEPARQSEEAFDDAATALEGIDSSRFIGPVQRQFDQLRTLVTDARATLGSTYRASRLIPQMMGQDRPRYYLLVLQNNAELRSGGGLPGALSLVRMADGEIDIVEQTDMSEIGKNTAPVVTLTSEENRVFGRILGLAAVNATLTPDFVRSAEIIRARWEREIGGRLDGMVFVDPVAISYLLRGTGPVDVPRFQPINAGNVVAAVENQIYQLTEDRQIHSEYQRAVSKAVFSAFTGGRGDTAEQIRGLVAAVGEGRIRLHSFNDEEQAEIAGTEIAGEFPRVAGPDPEVGIYINDGGPTKMQYFLKYDAAVFARSCAGGRQDISGSIEFHNDTPSDVTALSPAITGESYPGVRVVPGHQLLVIYLTSPIGGEVRELRIDGQRVVNPVVEPFAGRALARIGIDLEPQGRHRIEFVLRSGHDQKGDVDLAVTPGAFAGSPNTTAPSACTLR